MGPLPNLWLGVTAENQAEWDHRVPILKQIPAALRFVSCEPLLGAIACGNLDRIGWVIAGGENGPVARPCMRWWIMDIHRQCKERNVPFFFKHWGDFQVSEFTHAEVADVASCQEIPSVTTQEVQPWALHAGYAARP